MAKADEIKNKLKYRLQLNSALFKMHKTSTHLRLIMLEDDKNSHPYQALMLGEQLCFALYSTSLAMTKIYRKLLKQWDLTYPQYLVLMVLWEQDGLSVSQIGEPLFLDSATLTPLLKRMEAMGLLTRQRVPEDERQVQVFLTSHAKELREQALAIPETLACASSCDLQQLIDLREQLVKLRQQLHQYADTLT